MKHIKTFEKFDTLLENNTFADTSWEMEIDGKDVKITIQDVQNQLDNIIEIPVSEIAHLCIHKDKKDKATLDRSDASDLSYPIIIARKLDGKWGMILDGHHRLLKAINTNQETIKARVLDLKDAPSEYQKMFN